MEIEELRAFLALAEHGTLGEAARQSTVPRNTLRRRVEALEERLGTALLLRDARHHTLTAVGRRFVDRARALVAQADALEEEMRATVLEPAGAVRVLLPVGIHPLSAMLVWRTARERHPGMSIELRYLEDPLAGLDRDGDFALVLARDLGEAPGVARRVGSMPLRLLANRDYFERNVVPTTLAELAAHPLLCFDVPGFPPGTLPRRDGGTFAVSPALRSTNVLVLWDAARLGGGIALAPNVRLPRDGWAEEDVVVVLEDEVGFDLPIWLVARGALSQRPALRPLLDEIADLLVQLGVATAASSGPSTLAR